MSLVFRVSIDLKRIKRFLEDVLAPKPRPAVDNVAARRLRQLDHVRVTIAELRR